MIACENSNRCAPGRIGKIAHAFYKIDFLRIGRKCTGDPIGENDEYWTRSRAKIITGALPEELGNLVA